MSENQSNSNTAKGKGKQKKKNETKLNIQDMLGPNTSWNDMILMGDDDDCRPMPSVILPSAPKASLEPEFNPDDVPESAPFLGYVTNMHFEITEDMIKNHYKQFKNVIVKLLKDSRSNSFSIEFETREDLIMALKMPSRAINGRQLKLILPQDRNDRYGDRGGYNDRRGGRYSSDTTPSNWRTRDGSGGVGLGGKVYPPPTSFDDSRGSGGGGGGYGRSYAPRVDSYGGQDDYSRDRGFGSRPRRDRDSFPSRGTFSSENEDNWRNTSAPVLEPPPRESRDRMDRRDMNSMSYSRHDRDSRERDMEPRRYNRPIVRDEERDSLYSEPMNRAHSPVQNNRYDAPIREPPRSYDQPPSDMYPRSGYREPPVRELPPTREPPSRILEPPIRERTISDEQDRDSLKDDSHKSVIPPVVTEGLMRALTLEEEAPKSYSSIFGGAKPVDTTKREKEIEKKLKQMAPKPSQPKESAPPRSESRDGLGPRNLPPRIRGGNTNGGHYYDDQNGGAGGGGGGGYRMNDSRRSSNNRYDRRRNTGNDGGYHHRRDYGGGYNDTRGGSGGGSGRHFHHDDGSHPRYSQSDHDRGNRDYNYDEFDRGSSYYNKNEEKPPSYTSSNKFAYLANAGHN